MKYDQTKPIHDRNTSTQLQPEGNAALPPPRHVFTLGLDVDLHHIITAIQCDRGAIALAQKFSRARLVDWVKKQVAAGHQVHTRL